MLTVEIKINGRLIKLWKAVRIITRKSGIYKYSVNDGYKFINHKFSKGAVSLAQKLVNKIEPYSMEIGHE